METGSVFLSHSCCILVGDSLILLSEFLQGENLGESEVETKRETPPPPIHTHEHSSQVRADEEFLDIVLPLL